MCIGCNYVHLGYNYNKTGFNDVNTCRKFASRLMSINAIKHHNIVCEYVILEGGIRKFNNIFTYF